MANQVKYTVALTKPAKKSLEKISNPFREKIFSAIHKLAENPRPPGCIKLEGRDELWRIRIGDYRVIYKIEDKQLIIEVIRVANRREVYR